MILGLWVWVQGGYIRLDQNIADLSWRKQLYLEFYPEPRQNYIPQSNSYMMVNAFSRTVQLVTQCKVDLPRFMLPGKITVSYIDQGRTCECKIFWNTLLFPWLNRNIWVVFLSSSCTAARNKTEAQADQPWGFRPQKVQIWGFWKTLGIWGNFGEFVNQLNYVFLPFF